MGGQAQQISFPHRISRALNFGKSLYNPWNRLVTTRRTTAFDLRELAQWSVRPDMPAQLSLWTQCKYDRAAEERKRERERGVNFGFSSCWKCFCTLLAFTQRGQEMSKWQTVDLDSRKCQSCARFRVAAFGTRLNFELWAMDTRLKGCLCPLTLLRCVCRDMLNSPPFLSHF